MTVAMAWVGTRSDGREYLYMASDSRTRGGSVFDASPKILTLPRTDCAICFAGSTAATYPLMMQLSNAVAAHQPARERALDIATLKGHLLKTFTDLVASIKDAVEPFRPEDAQFLFGGYSWKAKSFKLWTIYYEASSGRFAARPAANFHPRLRTVAFVGDRASDARARLRRFLGRPQDEPAHPVFLAPFRILVEMLRESKLEDSIGGAPQLVQVTEHMNVRPLCVKWGDEITLFGRQLFPYENCDYWILDADSLKLLEPRKFGHRATVDSPVSEG